MITELPWLLDSQKIFRLFICIIYIIILTVTLLLLIWSYKSKTVFKIKVKPTKNPLGSTMCLSAHWLWLVHCPHCCQLRQWQRGTLPYNHCSLLTVGRKRIAVSLWIKWSIQKPTNQELVETKNVLKRKDTTLFFNCCPAVKWNQWMQFGCSMMMMMAYYSRR